MIKDFATYISEGLFDRSQSEFSIKKTDKGIEQVYIPKTKSELYKYIDLDIEQARKEETYPNVNLNNIDVSKLGDDNLKKLFSDTYNQINPDISDWNIKYIPNNFFYNNELIKEFTIPNSVTGIGDYAFCGCNRLASVSIPNGVMRVGDWTFCGCENLTFATIPNSVTSIGEYAFAGCYRLTSITIPNNVTSIECRSFASCSGLTSLTIPDSVTSIGKWAFQGCSGLTSVTIPNSVTSIGQYAFQNCSGLTSVTIGNSITSIWGSAFEGCYGLNSLVIPKRCRISTNSFPENCKIIRIND